MTITKNTTGYGGAGETISIDLSQRKLVKRADLRMSFLYETHLHTSPIYYLTECSDQVIQYKVNYVPNLIVMRQMKICRTDRLLRIRLRSQIHLPVQHELSVRNPE